MGSLNGDTGGTGRSRVVVDGEALKVLREGYPLTVRELAGRSGVSLSTISGVENNRRAPNPSTVRKLARALGVEPTELMRVTNEVGNG